MKKIYLQPEMELTECVMLRAAVCSGGEDDSEKPQNPEFPFGAPAKKVF